MLSACQKESFIQPHGDDAPMMASSHLNPSSFPVFCLDLINPCSEPACRPYYNCTPVPEVELEDDFATYDPDMITHTDPTVVANYLIAKNAELKQIMVANFPATYTSQNVDVNDTLFTYAALIHMVAEGQGLLSPGAMQPANMPAWVRCAGEVVGGVFTVKSIYSSYADLFKHGASWTTIRPVLKNMLRRYGGWISVGFLIYDIKTVCF